MSFTSKQTDLSKSNFTDLNGMEKERTSSNEQRAKSPEEKAKAKNSFPLADMLKGLSFNDTKRFYFLSLLFLIFLLILLFNKQILSYASSFLGAITLFAVLRSSMRILTIRYKWKKWLASGFLTILAIILFLIPLGGIVFMLIDLLSNSSFDFAEIWEQARKWNGVVFERFNVNLLSIDTVKAMSAIGQKVLTWLFSNLSSLAINSVLMIFLLYYMLYQRDSFERAIRELLPFTQENKGILVKESKKIIVTNAISVPVLALIQGLFAYCGYFFLGVSNPLFFAILTAFSTIIPIVGTMIVYLPIALYFAIEQEWLHALIMFLYGLIIIGGVDNVARFLLQKWIADIHPLITVFGVIFGMAVFGFWGVIFGPLLISLLILFLNMYRHDYVHGSRAVPRVTSPVKESASSEELIEKWQTIKEKRQAKKQ